MQEPVSSGWFKQWFTCRLFLLAIVFLVSEVLLARAGHLSNRLRSFDLLSPDDIGHKIVKRATAPSTALYNNIVDVRFFALDRDFRLTLAPKIGLFASDLEITRTENGKKTPVAIDREAFFTGHVVGERKSLVNLHIEDKQLMGSVQTEKETYYFEPAHLHIPTKANTTLVYRKSDILHNHTSYADHNHTTCGFVPVDGATDDRGIKDHDLLSNELEDPILARKVRDAIPSFVPTHTRCGLRLVADHRFFRSIGGKSPKRTITYLINLVDRLNSLYNNTNFNEGHETDPLLGYGFVIQAINVLTEPNKVAAGEEHYNDHVDRKSSKDILDLFSRESDNGNYCLAHLFTDQELESGVLGLAYVGNGRQNSAGGICSAPYLKDGKTLYLNSGLTTARNQYHQIVITREMELVTAHELGHNWGSQHDPETKECTPDSRAGGRYLMYMYSVSGLESNNKFFSPCSRRSIRDVLLHKSPSCFFPAEQSLCGNFLVEDGEDCDAGYIGADDRDACCDQKCKLRPSALCSDKNSICCGNCTYATQGTRCADQSFETCHGAAFCPGNNPDCPKPPPAQDGTPCFDKGQCRNGNCLSFCETKQLKSCVCDNITESCFVCCRRENETCKPFDFTGKHGYEKVPNGRSCVQGHCEEGECKKTLQDFAARVWLVIERIDFSNFAGFLKNNIVGVVIILSLIVWIPASCYVHRIDKKFREEHERDYGRLRLSMKYLPTNEVRRPLVDGLPERHHLFRHDGDPPPRQATVAEVVMKAAAAGKARNAAPRLVSEAGHSKAKNGDTVP